MSLDQRGYKTIIQQEGASFLTAQQQMLNATVQTVAYSDDGVTITLTDGTMISADYAICTFSVGVLQNDDVQFSPPLPRRYHHLSLFLASLRLSSEFKQEAIEGMVMATFTKIFLQFPQNFWFSSEVWLIFPYHLSSK